MRPEHDVVIVGAGPGGVATALVAARAGLRVLLLDRERFPRDKVCGDAITPLGMTMLSQLGITDAIRRVADEHVPQIRIGPGRASEDRTQPASVLVVRRRVLDAALLDLARPHVEVREGHAVDELRWCDGRVCGVAGKTDAGARFDAAANVVVGADGASSIVARLAGRRDRRADQLLVATRAYHRGVAMSGRALEFHFLPDLGGGYLWIFPVGADLYNVGLGGSAEQLRKSGRSLTAWCEEALRSPAFAARFASAERVSRFAGGQIPYHGVTEPIHGPGFLLVGDAAGLADAFWGDGIDTAMASGALAGAHLAAACRAPDAGAEQLSAYARSVARVLGRKLTLAAERQRAAARGAALTQAGPPLTL